MKKILYLIKRILRNIIKRHHGFVSPKYWPIYLNFNKNKNMNLLNPLNQNEYNLWLESLTPPKREHLKYRPLISIVIPVYNIKKEYLADCLDSVLNQTYDNFEICLADDNSTLEETILTLNEYEKKDKRIKVIYRKENGNISEATNSAYDISCGEYIAFMDNDDILDKDALYYVVLELNKDDNVDFIYTDEDKMNLNGKFCEPHFKSDFSRNTLYGQNYICHFNVVKKSLIEQVGKLQTKYNGAQDFDFVLRATEKAKKIKHISKVLYHWRKVPGSTADVIKNKSYALENGKKAVEDALKREEKNAYVTLESQYAPSYIVHYNFNERTLISVVFLDTKDEIIEYDKKELGRYYDKLEFIISKNIKEAVKLCRGKFILFVYGKIKLVKNEMLIEMMGYANQKNIGFVAPKIVDFKYNKIIKSAGIINTNSEKFQSYYETKFLDEYGIYGRLLMDYSYDILSERFIMIEREKIIHFDSLNSILECCIESTSRGFENMLLSNFYIMQKDLEDKKKEKTNEIKLKYYNDNLSKNYPFMLERK